jgi:hypothetical protein
MEQVADLPQGNGDLRQEFCVAQGSDKRCRLTVQGLQKLEDALKKRFGEDPSQLKVAEFYPPDRDTVSKIRNRQGWVTKSSIERLFTPLALTIEDDDYEQPQAEAISELPNDYPANPFWQTLPIDAPGAFIGRDFWFNELIELLDKGCSCNVIGPERMGRSSVLKQVCAVGRTKIRRSVGQFVYLNLREVDDSQDFFGALCHGLAIEPAKRGHALSRALRGQQHVVCLDDIEQLTDGQRFDRSERRQLRGLIDAGSLIVLIASKQCLSEVFTDSSIDDSPLYGICTRMEVPPFSQQDVERWVDYHLRQTGISFSPQQLKQLREKSKGVPGLLQQLARDLYDRVASGVDQV